MENRTHEELIEEFRELKSKMFWLALDAEKYENSIILALLAQTAKSCTYVMKTILDSFEED